MLAALLRLLDAAGADGLDEREAHVGESRKAIGAGLLLHLGDDVLHGVKLVLLEAKCFDDQLVALDELGRGVAVGQASALGVIGDKLSNGVDAAVHGAAVRSVRAAEVDTPRALAVAGHVDGVLHQLVYALVLGGRDGHHRHAQEGLQGVHVHGAAVLSDLIHHVEGDDHGNVQLHELRGEVEVALDVGGVNNVDDRIGLGVDDELAAHDLLARVGRKRVDARQVCDRGLRMAAHLAILAVHGDAGKVAHVLVGACELVEECGLAAVLVACQRKREGLACGHHPSCRAGTQLVLANGRVARHARRHLQADLLVRIMDVLERDLGCVRRADGELVAAQANLKRVTHRRVLDHGDLGARREAHIKDVLAQGLLFAIHRADDGVLADLERVECHISPCDSRQAWAPCGRLGHSVCLG